MAKIYKTPGVYIEERSTFPNSAVPVPTAVPAFIGYTEKAVRDGKPLTLKPTKISSYSEYQQFFGGAPLTKLTISEQEDPAIPYQLTITERHFTLHSQLRMFFSNGGGDCYIVSVDSYDRQDGTPNEVEASVLQTGLEPLRKEPGPTMVVIPELTTIHLDRDAAGAINDDDLKSVYRLYDDVLNHCRELKDRFAILDVRMDTRHYKNENYYLRQDIDLFRESITSSAKSWGAAYYPYLETTVWLESDVSILNIESSSLISFLKREFQNGRISDALAGNFTELTDQIPGATIENTKGITEALKLNSPGFKSLIKAAQQTLNLLPPSGAMAGIYSMIDNNVGVFKSPANVSVGSVIRPAINIGNDQQEDLNIPIDGKAVNAIRSFPGRGVLVWGARTLDGNSQDWRYVSVRRTVIFIEQSIKYAIEPFVFEPNTAATWSDVKAMADNFLNGIWRSGALAGATPDDAFSVSVGLGSTMTSVDILEGYMRINVLVAITRPAEFILITFEQKMQQS